MTRFSGYEPHECPSYARCPVCRAIPLDMLGKPIRQSDEYVLALMVEDGLISPELAGLPEWPETQGDPFLRRVA